MADIRDGSPNSAPPPPRPRHDPIISLSSIAKLIRRLKDAFGVSSVVETYNLSASLKIVDHIYFIHDRVVVAKSDIHNPSKPYPDEFDQQRLSARTGLRDKLSLEPDCPA